LVSPFFFAVQSPPHCWCPSPFFWGSWVLCCLGGGGGVGWGPDSPGRAPWFLDGSVQGGVGSPLILGCSCVPSALTSPPAFVLVGSSDGPGFPGLFVSWGGIIFAGWSGCVVGVTALKSVGHLSPSLLLNCSSYARMVRVSVGARLSAASQHAPLGRGSHGLRTVVGAWLGSLPLNPSATFPLPCY